jgi:hypothetical protein
MSRICESFSDEEATTLAQTWILVVQCFWNLANAEVDGEGKQSGGEERVINLTSP